MLRFRQRHFSPYCFSLVLALNFLNIGPHYVEAELKSKVNLPAEAQQSMYCEM
jgi:hypothetical protein